MRRSYLDYAESSYEFIFAEIPNDDFTTLQGAVIIRNVWLTQYIIIFYKVTLPSDMLKWLSI